MPPPIKHGTVWAYKGRGCRCLECKMARYNGTKKTKPFEAWCERAPRAICIVDKWNKIKDHVAAGLSDYKISALTGMSRPTVQRTRIKYNGKP